MQIYSSSRKGALQLARPVGAALALTAPLERNARLRFTVDSTPEVRPAAQTNLTRPGPGEKFMAALAVTAPVA